MDHNKAYSLVREVFGNYGYTDKFIMDVIESIHIQGYSKGYKEGREQQEKIDKLKKLEEQQT